MEITLTSTKVGSFNKFISKFERAADFVKIEEKSLPDQFKYDMLLRGIQHESYNTFLTTVKTRSPTYKYHELVYALQLHASEIEGKDKAINNTNPRSIAFVSKINGYDCDEYGTLSTKVWRKLTDAQKKAYWAKKNELQSSGKLKQGRKFKPSDDSKDTDIDKDKSQGDGKKKSRAARMKAKINKLEQQLKDYEERERF